MDIRPKQELLRIRGQYQHYFTLIDDMLRLVPQFLPQGSVTIEADAGVEFGTVVLALFANGALSNDEKS